MNILKIECVFLLFDSDDKKEMIKRHNMAKTVSGWKTLSQVNGIPVNTVTHSMVGLLEISTPDGSHKSFEHPALEESFSFLVNVAGTIATGNTSANICM